MKKGKLLSTEEKLRSVTIGNLNPLNGKIELVEYNEDWPALYHKEEKRIRSILKDRIVLIEHVGSTSVPGLVAKPIIDIVLVLEDSSKEVTYLPELELNGYVLRIREPDWFQHRMFKGPDTNINLHVFSKDCPEVERMIWFRNRLRTNEDDRKRYEKAKKELAKREWKYVQDYADEKTLVIQDILNGVV